MFDHATTVQHLFDQRLDSLKSGVHKLFEKATMRPTWFGRVTEKSAGLIKAHPIAAVGMALGVSYLIVRAIRR